MLAPELTLPNFKLNPSLKLGKSCVSSGINTYHEALNFVHKISYGRNKNPEDYANVVKERRGTSSTKHTFLYALAKEHHISSIKLMLGIYQMHENNTPGCGAVLEAHNLPHLLEARVYLKCGGERYDFSFGGSRDPSWEDDLLTEKTIEPYQLGEHKLDLHRFYLKEWITRNKLPHKLTDIWRIREECIKALSDTYRSE